MLSKPSESDNLLGFEDCRSAAHLLNYDYVHLVTYLALSRVMSCLRFSEQPNPSLDIPKPPSGVSLFLGGSIDNDLITVELALAALERLSLITTSLGSSSGRSWRFLPKVMRELRCRVLGRVCRSSLFTSERVLKSFVRIHRLSTYTGVITYHTHALAHMCCFSYWFHFCRSVLCTG